MRFIDAVFLGFWVLVGLVFPSVAFSADWEPPQLYLDTFHLDRERCRENDSRFSGKLVAANGELLVRFKGARTLLGGPGFAVITHDIEWSAEPGFRPFFIEGLKALGSRLPDEARQSGSGEQIQWSQIKSHLTSLESEMSSDLTIVAELNLVFEMLLGISKKSSESVAAEVGYMHRLLALWLGGFTRDDFFSVSLPDLLLTAPPLSLSVVSVDAKGVGFRSGSVHFVLRSQGMDQWTGVLRRQNALRKSVRPFVGSEKPVCAKALVSAGEALYPEFLNFWKRLLRFP